MSIKDLFGDVPPAKKEEQKQPGPVQSPPIEAVQNTNSLFGEESVTIPPAPVIDSPITPDNQSQGAVGTVEQQTAPDPKSVTPVPVSGVKTPVVQPPPPPAPPQGNPTEEPRSDTLFGEETLEPPSQSTSIFGAPLAPRDRLPDAELVGFPKEYSYDAVKPTKQTKVLMVYGKKGVGKTEFVLSLKGKIAAISFDRKTSEIWITAFAAVDRIRVFDAIQHMDFSSDENWLRSSVVSLDFLDKLLDNIGKTFKPDWIVIDGVGEFVRMAEMKMRYSQNFSLTQGVEWQFWKYRRMYIRQLHHKAAENTETGIAYTAFVDTKEKYVDGKIVLTEEQPKWVDIVEEQTDVVIRLRARSVEGGGNQYIAEVESSKWNLIRSGLKVDITVEPGQEPNCFDLLVEKSKGGR